MNRCGTRSRILIVDDQEANLYAMNAMLNRLDCDLVLVTSGEKALEEIKKAPLSLALVDVRMPIMDGFETAQALYRHQADLPIIFITAEPQDEYNARSSIRAGGFDILYKPIDREALLAKINAFLRLNNTQQILNIENSKLVTQNQALNEFTRMLAHDLRGALSNIALSLKLFKEKEINESIDEKSVAIYDVAEQGVKHIHTMFDDLLSYAQASGDVERNELVDLQEIVQRVESEVKAEYGDVIQFSYPQLPTIEGNTTSLYQLFHNLMTNATKYRQQGRESALRITVSYPSNSVLQLVFSDNGIGFDQELLPELLRPFTRYKPASTKIIGTGIGLATVKKVVELHGGRLWAESDIGVGTSFYVELPVDSVSQCRPEGFVA